MEEGRQKSLRFLNGISFLVNGFRMRDSGFRMRVLSSVFKTGDGRGKTEVSADLK